VVSWNVGILECCKEDEEEIKKKERPGEVKR
jgi:hypothetical protein